MTTHATVVDRVATTLLLQTEGAAMVLGDRLGLWAALVGPGRTVDEVAAATGVGGRYAREWCEAMAVSGYLEHDDGRFRVADEAVPVLADPDSPTYLLPLLRQIAGATASLRGLEAAYRSGGGFGWAEHDPDVRDAQGSGNAVALREALPRWVAEHLPDVADRLRAGAGRVADVGCGHGWAAVGLARAFPAARVDAFDVDGPSVEAARINAAGLAVEVHDRPLTPGDGPYDLVVMAEMLHDVPDPVALLRTAATCLAPGGVVFLADMAGAETLQTPGSDLERQLYGYSLLICLPDSLATPGSAGTGTVLRPAVLRGYVEAAGLEVLAQPAIEHDSWRFAILGRADV
ncbi:class I SAM-dependent methyltransferase [Jatrophihabitans sp. YIM 134969]